MTSVIENQSALNMEDVEKIGAEPDYRREKTSNRTLRGVASNLSRSERRDVEQPEVHGRRDKNKCPSHALDVHRRDRMVERQAKTKQVLRALGITEALSEPVGILEINVFLENHEAVELDEAYP